MSYYAANATTLLCSMQDINVAHQYLSEANPVYLAD